MKIGSQILALILSVCEVIYLKIQFRKVPNTDNLNIIFQSHSIHAKDVSGVTALYHAASRHHIHITRILLLKGADNMAETNHKRQMPLHIAVLSNNCDMVLLLLHRSASRWASSIKGNTALHLAVVVPNMAVLEILLVKPTAIDATMPKTTLGGLVYVSRPPNEKEIIMLLL